MTAAAARRIAGTKWILVAALLVAFAAGARSEEQGEDDPHRPACVDAQCQKAKSFLQAHYCDSSPTGDGPEDSCEITIPEKPRAGVAVVADHRCLWIDAARAVGCEQHGKPPQRIKAVLVGELRRLGLPAKAGAYTYFTVWKAARSGWSIGLAYYLHTVGSDIEVCEVIAVIDEKSRATVLRELPCQRTDMEVPTTTDWSLVSRRRRIRESLARGRSPARWNGQDDLLGPRLLPLAPLFSVSADLRHETRPATMTSGQGPM
jgi:hypothetical protein